MRVWLVTSIALASAALLAASAFGAVAPVPGLYEGKGKAGSARLDVTDGQRATVRYSLRGKCGRTQGQIKARPIRDGRFRGRKRIRSSKASAVVAVRGRFAANGRSARLTFSRVVSTDVGDATRTCRSRRLRLAVSLTETPGLDPATDAGHYAGASHSGLPISFDLAVDPSGRGQVSNLDVDVATECSWFGGGDDPLIDTQVVHVRDLAGKVDENGDLTVYAAPDEDTEYDIAGTLRDATADLEVAVDGPFDALGNPAAGSDLFCDNWGDPYAATRVG